MLTPRRRGGAFMVRSRALPPACDGHPDMACEPPPRRGPFNLGPARRPPARVSGDFSMILQRLREETRAAHDAIERDLEAFGAHRSLDRHRFLVARFFGFYAAWEPQVASCLADEPFFSPRRKLPLLEQDLE